MPSLGTLVELKGGGTPSRKCPDYWGGNIPWATVKDFKSTTLQATAESITEKGLSSSASNLIPAGNIIVPTRMAVGKVAINTVELSINQDLKALLIKNNDISDRKYLFWFLLSRAEYLESRGKGATVKGITLDVLRELEVPLPPLEEQKRIAAILDNADSISRKRQKAIELCDQFLHAAFIDLFGDPVINEAGWKEESLVNLLSSRMQNGAYYPKEEYTDDGTEMVHMSDAFYDVVKRGSLKRVAASAADLEKYKLTKEELLISRRSLNYEGAAKPCQIPPSELPLIFESSMIRLTPDNNKILTRYLFHYLSHPAIKTHFVRKFVTGATIKGISQRNLENIRILVPPLDTQKKFISLVEKIEALRARLEGNADVLKQLLASLVQSYFNSSSNQNKVA